MGWETRLFFANQDPKVQQELTLRNPKVARELFGEGFELSSYTEDRTDDYVWLNDCPHAKELGLKARGGSEDGKLELKIVTDRAEEEESLESWSKYRACISPSSTGEVHMGNRFSQFLEQIPQTESRVRDLRKWLERNRNDFQIVQVKKKRRTAFIDRKAWCVEETDCLFLWQNESLPLRSWAVESDHSTPLREIAVEWERTFSKAAEATPISGCPPSFWIASYPAMVHQLPSIFKSSSK